MKLLLAGLLAWTGVAFAANAPVIYHEGTLVSFSTQNGGGNCTLRGQQACGDEYQAQYLIQSEGILYSLTPVSVSSGSMLERATLVLSKLVSKNSCLFGQVPGTPLKLRDDGKRLFVKVGHHESQYIAFEADDVLDRTTTAQADHP